MTPYDRLTAALPESHDGPIGVIDSADLRAVLADAKELDRLRTAWRTFFEQAANGDLNTAVEASRGLAVEGA